MSFVETVLRKDEDRPWDSKTPRDSVERLVYDSGFLGSDFVKKRNETPPE